MTSSNEMWTTEQGIALCQTLEPYALQDNAHVALTGGLLYREGPRKDCDVVIYRRGLYKGEKELPEFDRPKFLESIKHLLHVEADYLRVTKCKTFHGKPVDLIFVNVVGAPHDLAGDSA